jgi:hypothetical protein
MRATSVTSPSPPTVPAIGADVAAAEIERLKAELADKTETGARRK